MFVETKREGEIQTMGGHGVSCFLDAADYMEKYGHCSEQARDASGAVCVIGAMRLGIRANLQSAVSSRTTLLAFLNRRGDHGCVTFNDTKSGPEVIAAMRACAKAEI